MTRVVVGLSGGVDSSVAAALLCEQGLEVHALFMFNWDEDEQGYCTAAEDFQDARQVCEQLDIPLHRVDFAQEYRQQVFEQFLQGLKAGVTPNPDVLCNREIKFGQFLQYARRLGAEKIATGHYARLQTTPTGVELLRGVDESKDQSYFLHAVSQDALSRSIFPLGDLRKTEVREMALARGLHTSSKRDSTGICFIGERPFKEFIQQYLPVNPGQMITVDGAVVGEHQGLPFYTLGQRQGLGLGGVRGAKEQPWYVVRKDLDKNVLVVTQDKQHPSLMSHQLLAKQMHWISGAAPKSLSCQVATRYRQKSIAAQIELLTDDNCCQLRFDQPQWAVTPGQYAVIYDGQRCLGGGCIAETQSIWSADSAAV